MSLSEQEKADLLVKLNKLINAYTSGASSISHNGKSVTFRSLSDIKAAIDLVDAELGIKKKTRWIQTVSHRGL